MAHHRRYARRHLADPRLGAWLYQFVNAQANVRIDAEFNPSTHEWSVSREAWDALKAQTMPAPPSAFPGIQFHGCPVRVVDWLPRVKHETRAARRKRRWYRIKEQREHERRMRGIREDLALIERLTAPRSNATRWAVSMPLIGSYMTSGMMTTMAT